VADVVRGRNSPLSGDSARDRARGVRIARRLAHTLPYSRRDDARLDTPLRAPFRHARRPTAQCPRRRPSPPRFPASRTRGARLLRHGLPMTVPDLPNNGNMILIALILLNGPSRCLKSRSSRASQPARPPRRRRRRSGEGRDRARRRADALPVDDPDRHHVDRHPQRHLGEAALAARSRGGCRSSASCNSRARSARQCWSSSSSPMCRSSSATGAQTHRPDQSGRHRAAGRAPDESAGDRIASVRPLLTWSTALLLRSSASGRRRPSGTEEEIHALREEGSEAGIIEKSEHEMVRTCSASTIARSAR